MHPEIRRIITNRFNIAPSYRKVPEVSIITVNYRQSNVTNELLLSLEKVDRQSFEVIVVDNSGDNDYLKLARPKYEMNTIVSRVNRGFAAANNLGLQKARGKYILLLNNDTEVDPAFLDEMIGAFECRKEIGAVSPKIKYFDNPLLIQYAGYSKMNPVTLRMKAHGSKKPDSNVFNSRMITNYAHGCAMMISRKVYEAIGPMPEEYFLYYEEHDWSNSIRQAGYEICYEPGAIVYHKESVSVKKDSPLKVFYLNRNRFLYMRRNLSTFHRAVSTVYMVLISVPKNTLTYIIRNQREHLKAYFEAVTNGLSGNFNSGWDPAGALPESHIKI
jgi:GT2 family glycosyltransferase